MKVGLYIPCFNAQRTIRQCLESVLTQTYPLEEILIVDDGSTDTTADIVRGYPVTLIRHAQNKGLAAARNTALEHICSEFIASLDADCLAQPDWLSYLMRHFDQSRIAGVGGKLLEQSSSNAVDLWRSVHMKQHWGDDGQAPRFLFGSNTVFRKKALIEAGRYNEACRNNYEDVDISRRLQGAGFHLAYEPKAGVMHLRKDDISSIFTSYWNWYASFYREEGYYHDIDAFIYKVEDNFGLANRYLEEDIAAERYELLYLDFLLALNHSLRDLQHFIAQDQQGQNRCFDQSALASWLALFDLTFFCHFNPSSENLPTFLSREDAFMQNIFAMNLALGKLVKDWFSPQFQENLYRDILVSLYTPIHPLLPETLLQMAHRHADWSALIKRPSRNLNALFLERMHESLFKWIDGLAGRFPELRSMIEASQKYHHNQEVQK